MLPLEFWKQITADEADCLKILEQSAQPYALSPSVLPSRSALYHTKLPLTVWFESLGLLGIGSERLTAVALERLLPRIGHLKTAQRTLRVLKAKVFMGRVWGGFMFRLHGEHSGHFRFCCVQRSACKALLFYVRPQWSQRVVAAAEGFDYDKCLKALADGDRRTEQQRKQRTGQNEKGLSETELINLFEEQSCDVTELRRRLNAET